MKFECSWCAELIEFKEVIITEGISSQSEYYHEKCWNKKKK